MCLRHKHYNEINCLLQKGADKVYNEEGILQHPQSKLKLILYPEKLIIEENIIIVSGEIEDISYLEVVYNLKIINILQKIQEENKRNNEFTQDYVIKKIKEYTCKNLSLDYMTVGQYNI